MPHGGVITSGVEDMTVAVMGCVVNGPGESKHANIGISLPGTGERPVAPVYVDGEKTVTLKGDHIAEEFQALVEDYVARSFTRQDDQIAAAVWRLTREHLAQTKCKPCEGGESPRACRRVELLANLYGLGPLPAGSRRCAASSRFKDFYRTMSFVNALAHIGQHRGPPSGPRSRLRLLPRGIQYALHQGSVRERLHLRREGRPDTARLKPHRGNCLHRRVAWRPETGGVRRTRSYG